MPISHAPTSRRRRSWYPRLMDWIWRGPLTRDLRPRYQPTRLHSFCALLADLLWYARSPLLPEKAKIEAAWTRTQESEAQ